ncbi:PREDICTED: sodium-independent sulfate anion transporter-like isoform X1 [Vollenhovia emeryi]|uniref:sodium-independent sulfate anion transporter-like isoform X1 n=1 Tax=Vollenhovia emeryi TaxID=411798 RepID=UPI0005F4C1E7|nr:PREDICTED: sodium-independent sulfate anion transporter-like isoform X1 [Vollenhovia emeryi]XP_011866894.1 PREDICTED: sodium-independent sulfate anion transporter-like isoform X1 [Vollenhovia emeryi]XP_011866895.1 PREDICTED: sodium-independent sulfate anion transporter-like isoform X1 [Vollenhovia emeryi]XP_011866896.1 PREDICTED: sodium-independent sulfate anion transporter-like isoform X1 [Vollenhovia emeryi]XP_011866897.1 PREDICTED: sodium-independent sulfate anion transporter-like isoform
MAIANFKRMIKDRIPILKWLPRYKLTDALGDLVAGFTVGLTLIPQAIAYAGLAGLEPQYGLYSAFAGSFVYIFLGTCREVNIGPTALISLLTWTYASGIPEYAALLCFLSGCITISLGILRLGFLIEFISIPVVSGFTSAASVVIACSQIKNLLGLNIHGESFVEIWMELVRHIADTKIPDLILSCCCILTLLFLKVHRLNCIRGRNRLRLIASVYPSFLLQYLKDREVADTKLRRFLWTIGTARNALVVVLCAVASYIFETRGGAPYVLTGHINAGLPTVEPPSFSRTVGNQTETFIDMTKNLKFGLLVIPLISIIGNVAIAKAFSHGMPLDATQEMLTLGLCNVVGSFFQSMPVTGSFSRSAVNNASGVRTPLGGIYTGILVILSLSLLTPYFYYIPKATLSAVIISAVIFMVEIGMVLPIWRCSKRDLIPAFITFLACLFVGVEMGILIGTIFDLAVLIYLNARPTINIERRNISTIDYFLVRPTAGILFPAVDHLRAYLTKNPGMNVVLDCEHIDKIDFTAAQSINMTVEDFRKNNCQLIMLRPNPDILTSIQSLSDKQVLMARNEIDLIAILGESRGTTRDDTIVSKTNERTSTWL